MTKMILYSFPAMDINANLHFILKTEMLIVKVKDKGPDG